MRKRPVDPNVYDLAAMFLEHAPEPFIQTLAEDIQRACDDACQEFEGWIDEQRGLKGLTDAERARI